MSLDVHLRDWPELFSSELLDELPSSELRASSQHSRRAQDKLEEVRLRVAREPGPQHRWMLCSEPRFCLGCSSTRKAPRR